MTSPLRTLSILLLGVLVGVVLLAAFRFAAAPPPHPVHHHANFAIFVDGQRLDLSDDRFMEDVTACAAGPDVQPRHRAHLHENNPDVVHVHHEGVTWGHFLANVDIGLGPDFLRAPDGTLHVPGEGRTLKLVLNGRPEFTVHNRLIGSTDRLLISFGTETEAEAIASQLPLVAENAARYNELPDPASCGGTGDHGSFGARLRHAFVG